MNNYHTHTWRCRHAEGDVPDYVEEARLAGMEELGFSDHMPWPDGRWSFFRMDIELLPGYVEALRAAREAENARPDGLSILMGLECEYEAAALPWMRERFLGELGFDYLALGVHCYELGGRWHDSFQIRDARGLAGYARQVERAAASGFFAYLAHPDVFCNSYWAWDADAEACARDVLAACEGAGLPIEVNANGLRKPLVPSSEGRRPPYPHRRFWELAAEYDVVAIAGSDAHRPIEVSMGLGECADIARRHGLPLVSRLPLAAPAAAGGVVGRAAI